MSDLEGTDQIVLEQLERLEDAEEERQKRSDNKLSSILAVIPLIATLASSVVISNAKGLVSHKDPLGRLVEVLVVAAVLAFLVAARDATRGLDPLRAQYRVHDCDEIIELARSANAVDLRRYLIRELQKTLPHNEEVNSRKFTDYRRAYQKVMLGMGLLTAALLVTVMTDLLIQR
jgi:hypothetical protein